MLVSSFSRQAINICPRSLVKRAKAHRVSLRHTHVNLVRHQPKITSSAQFADSRLFCKHTQIESHQTINPKDSSITMSDDAYSSFLDQANQDTGASKASTKSKSATTKAVDTDVPVALQNVDQYYTSESDEPFEPVSLKWSGKNMPSESMSPREPPCLSPRDVKLHMLTDDFPEDEFAELIEHDSEVSTLTAGEFDPRGEYKDVLAAVEKSGDGRTRIYRVEQGRARVEYYIVSFDKEGGRVVGLKAKAVES